MTQRSKRPNHTIYKELFRRHSHFIWHTEEGRYKPQLWLLCDKNRGLIIKLRPVNAERRGRGSVCWQWPSPLCDPVRVCSVLPQGFLHCKMSGKHFTALSKMFWAQERLKYSEHTILLQHRFIWNSIMSSINLVSLPTQCDTSGIT